MDNCGTKRNEALKIILAAIYFLQINSSSNWRWRCDGNWEECMKNIKNYYLSGVMGLVVGDAIGVPVEFMSRQELKKKPVVKMLSGGFHVQPVGTWSDDSSMALATLFSLEDGYNLRDIAEQFLKWKQNRWYTDQR